MRNSGKVAIIGAGSVGSTSAYACLLLKAASTLVMVDIDTERAQSEVDDLSDAAFITDSKVVLGDLKEAGQCDVIVITAGAKQRPGETRLDLIDRNYKILKSVIQGMQPIQPSAVLLLVANPVDVLTQITQSLCDLPKSQILGSGTFLDSQRLRLELSKILQIAETSIHAQVLGEHGDSQFVAWSCANAGGVPLLSMEALQSCDLDQLATQVRTKAYGIIKSKGSTYYGIGGCVAQIVRSILHDTRQIRPISHYIDDLGVCLSLPGILSRQGVVQTMVPPLSESERKLLENSAQEIKKITEKVKML